tara:strand:+ start:66 stop:566 length:501 start_codon:yes stop_codon:yes gene_type:complete
MLQYRNLKLSDADRIRVWRNKQLKILRQNKLISKKEQLVFFKKFILKKNTNTKLFAIEFEKKLIGYGGLTNISKIYKTAEISFLLDNTINHNSNIYEKFFTNFLKFIKNLSFKKSKIRRLYTETYSFRKKHIKILENCGFILEGIMNKHVVKNSKYYDSLIHGILK